MTQLSIEEHEAMMASMQAFLEQMPCVGIFWHDLADKMLFGVRKQELIEKEFSLPCFDYVYDYHWDSGHGWSGYMKCCITQRQKSLTI